MAVTTLSTTVLADDLTATVVTDIVQDQATGLYTREFRFFDTPLDGSKEAPLILIVRAQSLTKEALQVTTPQIVI